MIKIILFLSIFFLDRADNSYSFNKNDLQTIMPNADTFVLKTDPSLYYAYHKNVFRGICFSACAVYSNCRGYNGPVDILIGLDTRGLITGIKILKHRENITQAHEITNTRFLLQFRNKKITDPFLVHKDINNITGATITVKRTASIIQQSSLLVYKNYLLPCLKKNKPAAESIPVIYYYLLILIALACIGVNLFLYNYLQKIPIPKYLLLIIILLSVLTDSFIISFLYRTLIFDKKKQWSEITSFSSGPSSAEKNLVNNQVTSTDPDNYSDLNLKPKWGIQKMDRDLIQQQIKSKNLSEKEAENYQVQP